MLGVAGAIEAAARLREEGRRLRHSLEIWGFNMEESSVLGGDLWKPLCDRKDRSGRAGL